MREKGKETVTWTAVDLFAGCGGLSDGLAQAGFEVVAAVENDPLAARSYALNHRHTYVAVSDIRKVDPLSLLPHSEATIHLLAGCPPCQGFSRVRRKNRRTSVRDSRNMLLDEFIRFVEALKPEAIFLENVPGIERYGRFKQFLKRLSELNYVVDTKLLDLADYSVPQRRRRVVVLAGRGFSISFPKSAKRPRTVRQTIQGLPRPSAECRHQLHRVVTKHSKEMMKRVKATPKDGGSRSDWPRSLRVTCHNDMEGFYDVYGRMSWDDVAPTITGGCINASKGRFLHPSQNRTITLLEAALLQTFRRSYRFVTEGGRYHVAQMIGNALPPRFARRIAKEVSSALEEHKNA